MEQGFFEQPILNSPYEYPARHWELDANRQPTNRIVDRRRSVTFITPIPAARKQRAKQAELGLDDADRTADEDGQQYELMRMIESVRHSVGEWRRLPRAQWRVTPETARLLDHWRHHQFSDIRPFFCQVEAVETVIWLTEVAPGPGREGRQFVQRLQAANEAANPGLGRLALKLATGAGKTTVMAMLIAWQTINAVRHPNSRRFTRGFLVLTPGLTIRDRLRVLQPNDPDSYYQSRELVPRDLLGDLHRAKIVITNYHAFMPRETQDISRGGRALLQGRGPELQHAGVRGADAAARHARPDGHEAHHGVQRRGASLLPREAGAGQRRGQAQGRRPQGGREKQGSGAGMDLGTGGGAAQARPEPGARSVGHAVLPAWLRLRGGHPVSVDDERLLADGRHRVRHRQAAARAGGRQHPGADMPKFRNLWEHIGTRMPRKGRGKSAVLDPLSIPVELQTALEALYGHYVKIFDQWREAGIEVPPCFIVVCNNTATSKLVYDYISGFQRQHEDGSSALVPGRLELFRNFDDYGNPLAKPHTLLIDSEQLDSGEALGKDFRAAATDEIERFRREIIARTGDRRQAESLSDQDLLREVMNTVGVADRLGGTTRCVVSVSMLTEGWDARTVTHILGVRAFGTQLLCEQVVGRALRRQSYDLNEDGVFDVEYADVLGIPFDFTAEPVVAKQPKPRATVAVRAITPERDACEIRFPRVQGYRVELPEEHVDATFHDDSTLVLTPEIVGPSITHNAGIIGEGVDLSLIHRKDLRPSTLVYHLTKTLLENHWRDRNEEPKLHLFGQLKRVTRRWLDDHLVCKGGTYPAQLMYQELANQACTRITRGIVARHLGERAVTAVLDPYNPTGSTMHVNFTTSKPTRWQTDPRRCHVNWVVCDSDWEAEFCRFAESHPQVRAYVKNHALGLDVPYRYGSAARTYLPDFIVLVDDGHGDHDLLHLVVEIKGYRREDAKEKKATMETYWVPGVNRSGAYGRWAFAEFTDVYTLQEDFATAVAAAGHEQSAHEEADG